MLFIRVLITNHNSADSSCLGNMIGTSSPQSLPRSCPVWAWSPDNRASLVWMWKLQHTSTFKSVYFTSLSSWEKKHHFPTLWWPRKVTESVTYIQSRPNAWKGHYTNHLHLQMHAFFSAKKTINSSMKCKETGSRKPSHTLEYESSSQCQRDAKGRKTMGKGNSRKKNWNLEEVLRPLSHRQETLLWTVCERTVPLRKEWPFNVL